MAYKKELLARIRDNTKWPSFDRPTFLDELAELADEAYVKNTIEGYLASLLIYHQLCEEMVRLLLKDCQFFIQLSVFPAEILFTDRKRVMFGQLIEELKNTISFDNKDQFLDSCIELNKARIDIVHRLTKQSSVSEIEFQLTRVKHLYDKIFNLFEEIHDDFRVCFKDFRKDVFLEYSEDEFQ